MKPATILASLVLAACGCRAVSSDASRPPDPTDGCASPTLTPGVTKGSIDVGGVTRTYVLSVPAQERDRPVPVVFAFHGMGSNGNDFRNWLAWLKLEDSAAGPTIFVYPDGLADGSGSTGWPDTGGRDVALFDALLARIEAGACVDAGRVFVMGFSYGGFMSNTLGCRRAGVVRAIAPLSGFAPGGACNGQTVAVWMATGTDDSLLPSSRNARDLFAGIDRCTAATAPVAPAPCVAYQGCAGDAPVVWCEFAGVHEVQDWEPPALMAFFDAL